MGWWGLGNPFWRWTKFECRRLNMPTKMKGFFFDPNSPACTYMGLAFFFVFFVFSSFFCFFDQKYQKPRENQKLQTLNSPACTYMGLAILVLFAFYMRSDCVGWCSKWSCSEFDSVCFNFCCFRLKQKRPQKPMATGSELPFEKREQWYPTFVYNLLSWMFRILFDICGQENELKKYM